MDTVTVIITFDTNDELELVLSVEEWEELEEAFAKWRGTSSSTWRGVDAEEAAVMVRISRVLFIRSV